MSPLWLSRIADEMVGSHDACPGVRSALLGKDVELRTAAPQALARCTTDNQQAARHLMGCPAAASVPVDIVKKGDGWQLVGRGGGNEVTPAGRLRVGDVALALRGVSAPRPPRAISNPCDASRVSQAFSMKLQDSRGSVATRPPSALASSAELELSYVLDGRSERVCDEQAARAIPTGRVVRYRLVGRSAPGEDEWHTTVAQRPGTENVCREATRFFETTPVRVQLKNGAPR